MQRLPEDPELRSTVARWFTACRERPGTLPTGCEPVATRLVRGVGVGSLPSGGRAFVKVMAFPRPKDRLRYVHRALPAVHEARMLDALRRHADSVAVPEVLGVLAERRRGLPWLSVLVTRGLDISPEPTPGFPALAGLAARLASVGCFHRDFHPGNALRLVDGRLAVLDLQSATWRGRPLGRRERVAMAVKLLAAVDGDDAEARLLSDAGLVPADRLGAVLARAVELRRIERVRRIRRCLRTSTEFVSRLRLGGIEHRRRDCPAGEVIDVGRRGLRLWLGDRSLEVVEGREPSLCGLFRSWWWRPGRDRVYLRAGEVPLDFGAIEALLEAGHRTAVGGREAGAGRPATPGGRSAAGAATGAPEAYR